MAIVQAYIIRTSSNIELTPFAILFAFSLPSFFSTPLCFSLSHAFSPPPPPAKGTIPVPAQPKVPYPPAIPTAGPPGAFKLELMVFNGAPFKDHWAFWIPSARHPDIGVAIHVVGDVRNGFTFEAKRSLNLQFTSNPPSRMIPL
ncbi:hypothetical protein GGR55DRAFT_650881 [Xylaria sp. FL0064]|nr:hypothetical protein GGR55DRAFT_650881 [Xylaria sp. FL0064]